MSFLGKRSWLVVILVLVVLEVALVIWGIIYRRDVNRDFSLVSSVIGPEDSAVVDIRLEKDFYPTSFEQMETWGVLASPTGRIYNRELKNAKTGEILGTATVVEVMTRDRGDPNRLKRFPLIVQFTPLDSPKRNIMPWVLEKAAELSSRNIPAGSEALPLEQVAQIFPRGEMWVFVPLIDLDREELNRIAELKFYTEIYYGGTTYPRLTDLFKESPDRHVLLGKASIPILLLAVSGYLSSF